MKFKKIRQLVIAMFMLLFAVASNAADSEWLLYIYDPTTGSSEDVGKFQTTSTANVFTLENVEITATAGFNFRVHNNNWATSYGLNETVANTGQAYTVATGIDAGWSSLAAGTYDVTFNSTNTTIQFDEHSSGGDTPVVTKKVSILGDSYSTFDGYLPDGNASWYSSETSNWYTDNDVTSVDQTWWQQFFNNNSGYQLLVNNSYSGSTICNNTLDDMATSTSFISRASNLGDPDVILVLGGTNDWWNAGLEIGEYKYSAWSEDDLSQFRPGMAYLMNYLKTNHAAADIYFILNDMIEGDVYNSIVTICDHYNIPVIAPQGIAKGSSHPTEAGMTTIYQAVEAALVNNEYGAVDSWCLTGSFNNWSTTENAFTVTDYNPNIFAIDAFVPTLSSGYITFDVEATDWTAKFGTNFNISSMGSYFLTSGVSSWSNALSASSSYRVLWDKITHELSIESGEDEGNDWYISVSGGASSKFSATADNDVFELDGFTTPALDSSNGFSFVITTTSGGSTGYAYNQAMYAIGTYTMSSTGGYTVDRAGTWTASWGNAYCVALTAGETYKLTWNKKTHRLTIEKSAGNLVYSDGNKLRWTADGSEVRLFGANYCLPSASDYRAANYVGQTTLAQKKAMIDEDLDHFVRMGFDALRLTFYGDYENTNATGALVSNDHLTLLDYLIQQASARGIYMMLTPVVGFDSQWPENTFSGYTDDGGSGFARNYTSNGGKWQLLYSTETPYTYATTYIKALLNHTNSFTGRAIKDEPNIIIMEVLNEPAYDSSLLTYKESFTSSYQTAINGYVSAIQSTGWSKPIFFNVSQNMYVSDIIGGSDADGGTYAWYPFSVTNKYGVEGNGLLWVDRYEQLLDQTKYPFAKPKVVYEFDNADKADGYVLPAMTREFRRGGVQFATIYDYDMLRIAPYNNSNRTHYFNMVYTPSKAVSAMIAAEVMRQYGSGAANSYYPANNEFGNFNVDYYSQSSLLDDGVHYYYSNTVTDAPASASSIEHIAGVGSSPVVSYDGTGIYFLDKNSDGTWTLEVYPDITPLSDPFVWFDSLSDISDPSAVTKSAYNSRTFTISLPTLSGTFTVEPGIYTISNGAITASEELPAKSFYKTFENLADPTWTNPELDSTVSSLTLTNAYTDQWARLHYSRSNYHCPTSTMTLSRTNETGSYLQYVVTSLATSDDYTNYGQYPDATMSIYIGDRLNDYFTPTSVTVKIARTNNRTDKVLFLLVDSEGRAWGKQLTLSSNDLTDITFPVSDLTPYKAAMLPQDWPAVNNYWFPASESNSASYTTIDWAKVEFVQISMRNELYNKELNQEHGFKLSSVSLTGSKNLTLDATATVAPKIVPGFYNLTISRAFTPLKWNPVCLPIYLTQNQIEWYFGQGSKVASFSDSNRNAIEAYNAPRRANTHNGELEFSTTENLDYNQPYLLYVNDDQIDDEITIENIWVKANEPATVNQGDYNYVGTSTVTSLSEGEYYYNNGAFTRASGNETVPATSGYFTGQNGSPLYDGLQVKIDGVVTGIEDIVIDRQPACDNRVYNLQGQYMGDTLDPLPAGIYIVNNRKVVKNR